MRRSILLLGMIISLSTCTTVTTANSCGWDGYVWMDAGALTRWTSAELDWAYKHDLKIDAFCPHR